MEHLRVSRRELLHGILLGLALAGCGGPDPNVPLILALKQSIPGSLLNEFRRSTTARFQMQLLDERAQLLAHLRQRVQPSTPAGWDPLGWLQPRSPLVALSLLGADGLEQAIASDWLEPFPEANLGDQWADLDPRWQQAVQREGQVWGVPWRWGVTAIAYRRDRVTEPIRDWADL
ncbi:MAG: polyamine ABC transporter substrate-binding protein, partial [Cyanobacteriota bacterium]